MVIDEILNVTPQPPPHFNKAVDERLDRFILKALEKDPALRYNDATEMLQAFNALRKLGGEDTRTRNPSTGPSSFCCGG